MHESCKKYETTMFNVVKLKGMLTQKNPISRHRSKTPPHVFRFLDFSFFLGQNLKKKCAIAEHLKSGNGYFKSGNGYLNVTNDEESVCRRVVQKGRM